MNVGSEYDAMRRDKGAVTAGAIGPPDCGEVTAIIEEEANV